MGEGDEDGKLTDATLNSLRRADENHIESIAFPAVSTGIFGFPIDRAASIMIGTAAEYAAGETGIERVVFCLFGDEAYNVFASEFRKRFCGK